MVKPLVGGHLEADQTCRSELMEFRTRYSKLNGTMLFTPASVNTSSAVCDLDAVDMYASNISLYPDCATARPFECCRTKRHADHRSMYYLNENNVSANDGNDGQRFSRGYPIGDDVFGSESSALVVGDLDLDGLPDLIPNGIYINHGTNASSGDGRFHSVPD